MISVRNDDVLMHWNWKQSVNKDIVSDPIKSFVRMHEVISNRYNLIHIPTIVCRNIQEFPEILPYIKEETKLGRMRPELHGWDHVDYGVYTKKGISRDLSRSIKFMEDILEITPSTWYTPWGANNADMQEVAKTFNLKIIDCTEIIRPWEINKRDNIEVFVHWWEGLDSLKEMIKLL